MKIRLLCCCAALLCATLFSARAQAAIYATDFYDTSFVGGVDIYDDAGNLVQDGFIYGLNTPTNLVTDSSGNLYISSRFGGTVHAFGPNGLPLGTAPGALGLYGDASGDNAQFGGLAFAPNGDLYVTDNGTNTIFIYDGTSTAAASTLTVGNGGAALGMPTFDSNGDLYVTSFGSFEVYKYNGSTFDVVVSQGAGGLVSPSGIVVDDDGNMYVSGLGSNKLHVFDSTGMQISAIDIPFTPDPNASFPVNAPGGLFLEENGDILVAVLGSAAPGDVANGATFPGGGLLRYTPGDNSFVVLNQYGGAYSGLIAVPAPVPEPSSLVLAVLGLAGMCLLSGRLRRPAISS